MLTRVGGRVMMPEKMLQEYKGELPEEPQKSRFLQIAHRFLREQIPPTDRESPSVAHEDIGHRNWLVCKNYLYLVDWGLITFADPVVDIVTILGDYVPLPSRNQ